MRRACFVAHIVEILDSFMGVDFGTAFAISLSSPTVTDTPLVQSTYRPFMNATIRQK
jgi:hypothetical protein